MQYLEWMMNKSTAIQETKSLINTILSLVVNQINNYTKEITKEYNSKTLEKRVNLQEFERILQTMLKDVNDIKLDVNKIYFKYTHIYSIYVTNKNNIYYLEFAGVSMLFSDYNIKQLIPNYNVMNYQSSINNIISNLT